MQRLVSTALGAATVAAALGTLATACRLDPLIDDQVGASANLLPPGAMVPRVISNADLTNQLGRNDGIDTSALVDGHIIPRGTGASAGSVVRYWSFGKATRAPSPLYVFGARDTAGQFQPFPSDNPQLPLSAAMPGEYSYNPIHTVLQVAVTARYHGELIASTAGLADAIQIGLVEPPIATDTFVCNPIVRPGLLLDVGNKPSGGTTLAPSSVFSHGYVMDAFLVGATQPNPFGLLPTNQVSFLREPDAPAYNTQRPIFQAQVPTVAAPSYTPLGAVVNVDLTDKTADTITREAQLFTRDATGAINMVTGAVSHFAATGDLVILQIQFREGSP